MRRLEELTPGDFVKAFRLSRLLAGAYVRWLGTMATEASVKEGSAAPEQEIAYRTNAPQVAIKALAPPWLFPTEGDDLRLPLSPAAWQLTSIRPKPGETLAQLHLRPCSGLSTNGVAYPLLWSVL